MDALGKLNEESKCRVSFACDHHFSNPDAVLLCSGSGFCNDSDICISNQMKKFAVGLGVDSSCIVTDTKSKDTVGDAFFTKVNVVAKQAWKNLLIVTTDYHVDRAEKIFNFIYGPSYTIKVIGCSVQSNRTEALEKKSMNDFTQTFKGVKPGDDQAIEKRLISRHPFYLTTK
ncbi:MAG: hypothetical protein ACJAZ2_002210 [Glaciecola sp.]|jgi:hypothetical protein